MIWHFILRFSCTYLYDSREKYLVQRTHLEQTDSQGRQFYLSVESVIET